MRERLTRFSEEQTEIKRQAFLAWLPSDLRNAPGLDWTCLSTQSVEFLSRRRADPDAAYLAIAAATAAREISADSQLSLLRNLHAFFTTLRNDCGMQRVSDLRRESLWHAYAQQCAETRARSQQLSAYSSVSTKHLSKYLNGIEEAGVAFTMQQYELPPMPQGFLARVGKANELNNASRMRTRRAREVLLPLYPLLGELALLRKQLVERLLHAVHQAQQRAQARAALPFSFSYAETIPSLHDEEGQREIRRRPLTLRFILWDRQSWVLEHPDRFSESVVHAAQRAREMEAPAQVEYFVQFEGPAADLFWFGDLVEQRLFSYLSASSKGASSAARLLCARKLGFPHGCATQQGGLLHTGSSWFTEIPSGEELLFEPEALYRGVLYGAALVTLSLTTGCAVSELLQVSATRWGTTPDGHCQHLLPERARSERERRPFAISPSAALLLGEMEHALEEIYGEVPVVPPSTQISKRELLAPERYLFQWRGSMVNPYDTQVLARFLMHDAGLPSSIAGRPFHGSMELLRYGGHASLEERGQELQRGLGFNQNILSHLSPPSLDLYCRDLFSYWQFAGSREAALQPLTLARWMVQLGKTGREMSTINRSVSVVKQTLEAAAERGYIERERAAAFQSIEKLHEERESPTQEEQSAALVSFRASYKKCGKPSCSLCQLGKGHGPYWYGYRRVDGKQYAVYVGREKNERTVAQALQKMERRLGLQPSAEADAPPPGATDRRVPPDTLAALAPALSQLVLLRKQFVERVLSTIHQARQQSTEGVRLPLRFQHADVVPELDADPRSDRGGTIRIRERVVILTLTLWDKRSWVLSHQDRYTSVKIRLARQGVAAYRDDRNTLFVQAHDPAARHLWFGDLLAHNLLRTLAPHLASEAQGSLRSQVARSLGFPRGCSSSRAGLLSTGDSWFSENTREGELLFEPEALYRGVLYGAAIATLALVDGYGSSELLQISADRWVCQQESSPGHPASLSPPVPAPVEDGHLYEVSAEAAELLAEIERGLIQAHARVPQVPGTVRVKGLVALRPECYLFQWQNGILDPADLTVLVRFVLHGLRLPDGQRLLALSTELLKESAPLPSQQRKRELLRLRDTLLMPLAPGLSRGTLATYRQNLMMYLRFAGSAEQAYQPDMPERWIVYLTHARPGKLLGRDTANRMATPVRMVMAEAVKSGRLADASAAAFSSLKTY